MEEIMTQSVRQRIEWLDSLKGFAIIAVVLGHALLGYTANNAFGDYNEFFIRLKDWIYIWHMPLFMSLSGYSFCLAYYRHGTLKEDNVKKQILNLFFLYILFSVVFYALKVPLAKFTDEKLTYGDALINIFIPNTLMWYLWVLAIYYVLILYCKSLIRAITLKPFAVLSVLLVVAMLQRATVDIVDWRLCFGNLFHLAFYFCLGMSVRILRKKFEAVRIGKWSLLAIGTILIIHFICYMKWKEEMKALDLFLNEFIAGLIIVVAFASVSKCHMNARLARMLSALGRASLVIYLLHTYIVTAMKYAFTKWGGAMA